ncbi:MAG TPA: hypothetical protein DCQ31_13590, partial [Bacteroidales bacterium]|nr:hypothetical protein [Bacteroidales bacterium]
MFLLLQISLITSAQTDKGYIDGQVRIKLTEEGALLLSKKSMTKTKSGVIKTGLSSIDKISNNLEVVQFERLFPYNPQYDARHRKHGLHLWYTITYRNATDAKEAVRLFAADKSVGFAEKVLEAKLIPYKMSPFNGVNLKTGDQPFDDPYLPSQWHYNNTGQTGGTAGSDINLFEAWKLQTGKSNVIVSIHDQGVDFNHQDLAANMWVNEAEKNGLPGVDDDFNKYVDDIYGVNFRTMNGEIKPEPHGTHVAGTIAAVNNNGVGVSGVAGGSGKGDGVRIMSCQILENANNARSFQYAADNGAVISQNSWGYTSPGVFEQSVLDAIDYFVEEAGNYPGSPMKGGVVIFAAGNDGADGDYYPGYYHNVVAVSATGPTNKISWFSNYGEWVDISAPGGDMSFGGKNGVLSSVPNNGYEYMEGTSMACPHVSGVAALIASQFGGEGFTNDRLLAHLLTSVNDIYDINPNYTGKMGLGITDSRLALQANNGIAPVKIENITVVGAAQDFITLEWLAPADADDSNPVSYVVYYAIDNLDIDNLNAANKLTIKSKVAAGEKVSAELKNLLPVSTYKIAVKAFDRWGNASVLSVIVEAKTNDGPKASLKDAKVNVTIDASINKMATDKFTLFNEDKGVLRWKGEIRHSSQTFTYSKMPNFNSNTVEPMAVYKPNLGKLPISTSNTAKTKSIVDNVYITKSYFDWVHPVYVVGDEDLALPNSSATRFFVSETEGFNLTNVSMWLNYDYSLTKQPVIMQIFAGEKMETGNLVYEQALTDTELYSKTSNQYGFKLTEQIYFESGSTFWIVFHSVAGNKYPLGVAYTQDATLDPNGLMSFNLGKTWVSMKEVFGEPGFIWTTTAISQSTPIHKYITLMPSSGEVLGNESKEIQLSIDGTRLINGTYNAAAVLSTNDTKNRFVKLPISIEVLNQKPILKTEEIYNLGNVFMGGSKDFEIKVKNNGYGNFSVDYGVELLTFDNPEFSTVGYPATRIAALDSATFKIRFTPSKLGNSNAVVTMLDKNGFAHKFNLFAAAVAPAKIELLPNEATYENVAIGDVVNGSINVTNIGEFPLKYYLPAFADGSNIEQKNNLLHKFGYNKLVELPVLNTETWETTLPASFVWNDISTTGTEITNKFFINNRDFYHFQVDLGFQFPFFGEKHESAYLTSRGVIAFDTNSSYNNVPLRFLHEDSPNGYISAWSENFWVINGGNIYYKREPGKFIIQYNGLRDKYDWMSGQFTKAPVEFQMILSDNGNIQFIYNKVTQAADGYQLLAIENKTHTDGLMITNYDNPLNPDDPSVYITDGTVVSITNPGLGIISEITNPFGLVQVGETAKLDYKIETGRLNEGQFTELLNIVNTDPANTLVPYKINLNIVSGGAPKVALSATELNFGAAFQTSVKKETLIISNIGTKAATITEIKSANNFYSANLTLPLVLKAGQKVYAEIVMNTIAVNANLADILTITTDETVNNTHTVTINGKVELAPKIEVNIITDPTQTIVSSETAMSSAEFSVKNTGETDLTYAVEYSEWLYPSQMPAGTNFDYTWRTNKKATNAPGYNWIDITKTGKKYGWKENSIWFGKIMKIELPWAFNFFGTEYTTIRAAETGVVWFDAVDELEAFPPDYIQNGEIKNLIAPLWLAGGFWPMSGDDTEPALFYQAFDDYMVFSWKKMGNLFGMGDPIDFQMILYKNGNIKFQYTMGNDFTSRNGIVGYAKDGKYLEICNRTDYLTNGTAILITPVISQTLAKGETMNHKLKVDARLLNAGVFDNPLHIANNTPLTGMVSIPATLTVTGAPIASVANLYEYGSVMPYDTLVWGAVTPKDYIHEFEVKNLGTDVLSLSNFAVENTDGSLVVETLVPSPWGGSYWDDVMNLWE